MPRNAPSHAPSNVATNIESLQAELVDLESSPSYLMLTSGSLQGETARRVGAAMGHAAELWPLVHQAADALAAGQLQAASATVERCRTLLEPIRDAVVHVDGRWLDLLPGIDAARATVQRLRADAERLAIREPLIGRASALADDLERRLLDDPYSIADEDADHLAAQVAAASSQMASLRAGHDDLETDFEAAEALLSEIRVLRATAQSARAESLRKVQAPTGLITVPGTSVVDGPNGLADLLDEVFESERPWTHQRHQLDAWLRRAERLRDQLAGAARANQAPLDQRDELRGRLAAYRAKMAGVGRAEDLHLSDLADRARSELYTAPVDLGAATDAIESMARGLRS